MASINYINGAPEVIPGDEPQTSSTNYEEGDPQVVNVNEHGEPDPPEEP